MTGMIAVRKWGGGPVRWTVAGAMTLAVACWGGRAVAQAPDRVVSTERTVTGKVVSVSTDAVEIEERGELRKIPIDQIRDVQFGGEPQSLRAARSMLARGRAADAAEEVAKVGTEDLDGAEPLVLEELEFVKAAAAGRAVLAAAGSDPKDAGRMVKEFLDKHPQSHHFYDMQQLLGDLLVRAGKADAALAAYATLAQGPVALKVRSAAAKAGMLFDQQKFAEAMAEYDTALAFDASDEASAEQKRGAELGKARCLAQLGKNADAVALVQGVIKRADPEEKELLGRAYNVLGGAFRMAGDKDQDALISFLTVDLVYNVSPDSHAEALANLAELWEKGKNPERAREARKSLQDSYPSSPWAKKVAVAEGA